MTQNELIELFWDRNERAIEEMQKEYGGYCFIIANNILNNEQNAEECVNDAWMRVWNSIPPSRPDNFRAYLAKITRNLSVDRLKYQYAEKRNVYLVAFEELEECLFSSDGSVSEQLELEALQQAINRFLRLQPKRERAVFLRRYFFGESVATVAQNFGLSVANTTKILSRTRAKLKLFLEKEGYLV